MQELKDNLDNEKVHFANEALFITIGKIASNNEEITPKPIMVIPICTHKSNSISSIVSYAIRKFHENNKNARIVAIATDGDPTRRKILKSFLQPTSHHLSSITNELRYFDQEAILGNIGLSFDPKHLIKRLRGFIISDKRSMTLSKTPITKQHIRMLFNDRCKKLDYLLNPKDHQNVPAAVDLLRILAEFESMEFEDPLKQVVVNEFQILSYIAENFLNIFTNTAISLLDQLISVSRVAHTLLFVFRKHKTNFLTTDLYQDLQSTLQCFYLATMQFQKDSSDENVYLYQLGTDELERLFSTVRTITHAKNCDFLELTQRLDAAFQIESVYQNAPHLRGCKDRLATKARVVNDHSSVYDWNGELKVHNLQLQTLWKLGLNNSLDFLTEHGLISFFNLALVFYL